MCIRDRVEGVHVDLGALLQRFALQKTVYSVGGNRAVPDGGCLLYTSDAADERSSVDLGGRRIIKKKKY